MSDSIALLAEKLYANRVKAKFILGDDYKDAIGGYASLVKREMQRSKSNAIQAAINLCNGVQKTEHAAFAVAICPCYLAAALEIIETEEDGE